MLSVREIENKTFKELLFYFKCEKYKSFMRWNFIFYFEFCCSLLKNRVIIHEEKNLQWINANIWWNCDIWMNSQGMKSLLKLRLFQNSRTRCRQTFISKLNQANMSSIRWIWIIYGHSKHSFFSFHFSLISRKIQSVNIQWNSEKNAFPSKWNCIYSRACSLLEYYSMHFVLLYCLIATKKRGFAMAHNKF